MTRGYLLAMRSLGALLLILGIGMATTALSSGGGPLAVGVVVGVAFAVTGAGRLWLARDGGP